MQSSNFKIKIYGDGFTLDQINSGNYDFLDGYTFNPSLFKNNGVQDYLNHCKEIISIIKNKPVSLEVIADDEENMIRQAEILGSLSENVYIKIPITFTSGESTLNVINYLKNNNFKVNVTAIFSNEQVSEIIPAINETTILSIFAGRLYDIGIDATEEIKKINTTLQKNYLTPQLLWASPRMTFDIINAINSNCQIITMTNNLIDKLKLHKFSKQEYSLETVKMFYNDATSSKYNF